jgi:uncharacterized membrane protein
MLKLDGKARAWLARAVTGCVVGGAPVGAAAATPPYRFFELTGFGTRPYPTTGDSAFAINNQGAVVGEAVSFERDATYGQLQPVRWDFGQGSTAAVQLPLLNYGAKPGSFNGGHARAVDEAGNVFGSSSYYIDDRFQVRAVAWMAGSSQPTPLPPASWDPSGTLLGGVIGAGPVGKAVGYWRVDEPGEGGVPVPGEFPVVWTLGAAAPTELARLSSDPKERSYAVSMNSSGAVAGHSTDGASTVAVVWDSATAAPRVLPHLKPNWKESQARAINDSGLVAGYSTDLQFDWKPVLWRPGAQRPSELQLSFKPPHFLPIVNVLDMNNAGAVVGNAEVPSPSGQANTHAVIWDPLTLKVIDLNDWVDLPSGWTLQLANGINDKGQIVGTATYDPDVEGPIPVRNAAFVLDPVLRLMADANNDNRVDFRDFQIVEVNFGKAGDKSMGDFDGDGVVGSGDFNMLRAEFGLWLPAVPAGAARESAGAAAVVPEPGVGVVVVGAAVWGFRRSRRNGAAT